MTEWISWARAAELVGCSVGVVEYHARAGRIAHRSYTGGPTPTLDRSSVEAFADSWGPRQEERARRRQQRLTRECQPAGPPDDGDVWLSAATAALVLGCTPQWIGRLAANERIPAMRRGRRWWLRRRHVEQLAAARAFGNRLDTGHRANDS